MDFVVSDCHRFRADDQGCHEEDMIMISPKGEMVMKVIIGGCHEQRVYPKA